jgi:hypothetical protein
MRSAGILEGARDAAPDTTNTGRNRGSHGGRRGARAVRAAGAHEGVIGLARPGSEGEERVAEILTDLGLANDSDVVLIDARALTKSRPDHRA